jgi:hypothetical protein
MKHKEPLFEKNLLFFIFNMYQHLILIIILAEAVSLERQSLICILIVILQSLIETGGLIDGA